jgi:NADH-quinone oxidoreductase subunit M
MNQLIIPGLGAVVLAGLLSLVLLKRAGKLQWVVFFAASLFLAYVTARLYGRWGEVESFGSGLLQLSFAAGKTGWLFASFSIGVTVLIGLFSLSYNDRNHSSAIAPLWTLLMAANLGIFLAADWLTFIIAWELMGWTSFFIISHGRKESFRAGIYYFSLSLIGTAALLAAVFILYSLTGTLTIADSLTVLAGGWKGSSGRLYTVIVLLTVAFAAKSAVGPFTMWPAKAHAEAPDDFSAFLSGIMIKYGIYGMVAFVLPLFGSGYTGAEVNGTPVYLYVLGWIGAFTAVYGTLSAIRENDMKRLMAYSTVSHIGFIVLALSVNSPLGTMAALFHSFNHMVFKAAIFLSLAAVKFRTGEREMHRLGGLAYRMPVAFFVFLLGIIAAAGIPPMSGFASKWLIFQSLFSRRLYLLAVGAFFASTAGFMYLYRGLHAIYLGQLSPRFAAVKPAPPLQSVAMIVLMLLIYAVGTFPGLVLEPLRAALPGAAGALNLDLSSITGVTARVNLTHVSLVFMGSFLGVLALYFAGKSRAAVAPLDTYTAGETPEDWNMTPEQYHYAYHFYEPFEKMTGPFLDGFSFERWFGHLSRNLARLSGSAGRWLAAGGLMLAVSALAGLLLWGVLP